MGFVPFYLVQLTNMSLFPNIRFRLGGRRGSATLLMFSQFSQTSAPSLTKGILFVILWLVCKSEVTIQEPTIITKDEPFPFLLLSMGMINHDPSHCSMFRQGNEEDFPEPESDTVFLSCSNTFGGKPEQDTVFFSSFLSASIILQENLSQTRYFFSSIFAGNIKDY